MSSSPTETEVSSKKKNEQESKEEVPQKKPKITQSISHVSDDEDVEVSNNKHLTEAEKEEKTMLYNMLKKKKGPKSEAEKKKIEDLGLLLGYIKPKKPKRKASISANNKIFGGAELIPLDEVDDDEAYNIINIGGVEYAIKGRIHFNISFRHDE